MRLSDKKSERIGVQQKTIDNATTKASLGDEEKVLDKQFQRHQLIKKLTTQSAEHFRQIDINQYDLNITEHFELLEQIDSYVTPLIYCAFFGIFMAYAGLKEICKILLQNRQIDVDLQTVSNRQTPLLTACICGNYQIARLLLLANAEVNKPNLLNHIPLTVTIFRLVEEPASFENKKICIRIAELLVKNGADVNWIVDKKKGYTLLHYFCSLKMKMNNVQKQLNYEIIVFLLERGARADLKSLDDKTCLELLNGHCNKQEIKSKIDQYNLKQTEQGQIELKRIKRIDIDYFKIDFPKQQ